MSEWRELKTLQDVAAAMDFGDEIQIDGYSGWENWEGTTWIFNMKYRARPRPKTKMRVVKSLCWRDGFGNLLWTDESGACVGTNTDKWWQRFPAGDIEGAVEE